MWGNPWGFESPLRHQSFPAAPRSGPLILKGTNELGVVLNHFLSPMGSAGAFKKTKKIFIPIRDHVEQSSVNPFACLLHVLGFYTLKYKGIQLAQRISKFVSSLIQNQ